MKAHFSPIVRLKSFSRTEYILKPKALIPLPGPNELSGTRRCGLYLQLLSIMTVPLGGGCGLVEPRLGGVRGTLEGHGMIKHVVFI